MCGLVWIQKCLLGNCARLRVCLWLFTVVLDLYCEGLTRNMKLHCGWEKLLCSSWFCLPHSSFHTDHLASLASLFTGHSSFFFRPAEQIAADSQPLSKFWNYFELNPVRNVTGRLEVGKMDGQDIYVDIQHELQLNSVPQSPFMMW